ncbi:MAG TPA: sigma-54 dependent transcriptional regulator [Pyrinomonadaceae bacterium]
MATPNDFVLRLVVVDDEPMNLNVIRDALEGQQIEIFASSEPQEGLELVRQKHPHLVLLDFMMPHLSGLEMLDQIVEMDPGIDVILITGHYSPEVAVEAIQKGACDFFAKPLSVQKLRDRIGQFIEAGRQRQALLQLETQLLDGFQFEGMVGRSPQMLDLFRKIRMVAPHYRTVLLLGETGTGKELAAKALHRLSPVSSGPFVVCNCSALVETLFESELFGYVKGAFTGAAQDKIGLFEFANNGTLLLDEIGDLPLAVQVKLLRILQNKEVQRVGSPVVRKVNVRVIAATHRDLRGMVAQGTFREDLYHRLSMMEIHVCPLRERQEDFAMLERYFIRAFATEYKKEIRGMTRRAQSLLARYNWPGNVRELENVIGHACMIVQGEVIDIRDMPERFREQRFAADLPGGDAIIPLEEFQLRYVRRVVEHTGNKSRAAELLGISRATLYRMLGGAESEEALADGTPTETNEVRIKPKGTEGRQTMRRGS